MNDHRKPSLTHLPNLGHAVRPVNIASSRDTTFKHLASMQQTESGHHQARSSTDIKPPCSIAAGGHAPLESLESSIFDKNRSCIDGSIQPVRIFKTRQLIKDFDCPSLDKACRQSVYGLGNDAHGRSPPTKKDGHRYLHKQSAINREKIFILDSNEIKGVFEGEAEGHLPNGHGKVVYENGYEYEGDWMKGEYSGTGELTGDKFVYKGEFKNSRFDGKGQLSIQGAGIYEGMFWRGKFSGYGVFRWPNGKVYKGNWKESRMHYKGMLLWPDGRKYIGGFNMGKKEGKGIYYFAGGMMIEGRWKSGKLVQVMQKRPTFHHSDV